jgi:hypothetical protein
MDIDPCIANVVNSTPTVRPTMALHRPRNTGDFRDKIESSSDELFSALEKTLKHIPITPTA